MELEALCEFKEGINELILKVDEEDLFVVQEVLDIDHKPNDCCLQLVHGNLLGFPRFDQGFNEIGGFEVFFYALRHASVDVSA